MVREIMNKGDCNAKEQFRDKQHRSPKLIERLSRAFSLADNFGRCVCEFIAMQSVCQSSNHPNDKLHSQRPDLDHPRLSLSVI